MGIKDLIICKLREHPQTDFGMLKVRQLETAETEIGKNFISTVTRPPLK